MEFKEVVKNRYSCKKFSDRQVEEEKLSAILEELDTGKFGTVLRAKGMLPTPEGTWLYFDLTPGEYEIREGSPEYTGRLCVIGAQLDEKGVAALFGV